jgi:L-alanine-DL-glutamate epimerase-like enolase superfamily enzyme
MTIGRREFLAMPAFLASPPTDVRIDDLRIDFEDFRYRAPYKFGGKEVDRVTMLNVRCRVSNRLGKSAEGLASMSMGNVWSFPAPDIPYDGTLAAMKALAEKIARVTRAYTQYAHPLDVNHELEPEYLQAAAETSRELKLPRPIPKLCMLVTASPVDAALHDAFGMLHGRNAFHACGKEFVRYDLEHYLGRSEFRGEFLDGYVLGKMAPRVRMFHSVGASDALTPGEVKKPVGDDLPETLEAWIPYSGIRAIKIKLNGNDLAWDVDRVASIHSVTAAAQAKRGFRDWVYSLDFNERCPNVQYVLEFEHRLKEKSPQAFGLVQYLEQPTARDLQADRKNTMFEVAKLRPVVIDESLTGLDMLLLAREMGYTGAALKACKGQSQTLLLAAAMQKYKMFLCVQDLTCPGAALVHSVGIAAHIPGVSGLEANAREYVPAANRAWEKRFPGIFDVRNGYLETAGLDGPGLCTQGKA